MDPVTIGAVLAAVAAGTGGALGAQVWAGVSALVRLPFRRAQPVGDAAAVLSSGEAELAALAQPPADQRQAVALAEVLVARADGDAEFREALQVWWAKASRIEVGGNVTNTIGGGTQYGPVLQGRDFSGLTFTAGTPPPTPSAADSGT